MGKSLGDSITITCKLAADQRGALEHLLFFNVNQHRVRLGIQQSIEIYGEPEIHESEGSLHVRVGDVEGVQTLFAVSARRPSVSSYFTWASNPGCAPPRTSTPRSCSS